MRYRWQYDKQMPNARNIETRYFYGYGVRASNYRNTWLTHQGRVIICKIILEYCNMLVKI